MLDRPKGTVHPQYSGFNLKNTTSMEDSGIDVRIGSEKSNRAEAVMCAVGLLKRDSEIKILMALKRRNIEDI